MQKEYARAIDDISRCLALGRSDRAVFVQRARYYSGFGQHQNAVNDLNRVLLDNPDDQEALLLRSAEREANLDLEGALKDLETVQRNMEGNGGMDAEMRRWMEESRVRIGHRIFEMNREADPPIVTVLAPYHREGVAQVSRSLDQVKVAGYVRDKSLLKSITVNGKAATFDASEKDPQYEVVVPLEQDEEEIIVQAMDVYENLGSTVLTVQRTEGVAPIIAITTPRPTSDRILTIAADAEEVFFEGRVNDESLIRLITVNGINASYPPDQLDPDFGIKLVVKDKDRIVVRAEDQFGNATETAWSLVRKAPEPVVAAKPVTSGGSSSGSNSGGGSSAGTSTAARSANVTWVVHIENGNYREFPALQANANDKSRMQKAFANYNVQRTINKKNLTKEQMERFFNVELREMVRSNKVNTILVWYAGHGKTVGGKAYWIPVDGRKDDIYSYFNYGSLKAQMQNYSESVNNTVVVSDAAGGDASFFELTR